MVGALGVPQLGGEVLILSEMSAHQALPQRPVVRHGEVEQLLTPSTYRPVSIVPVSDALSILGADPIEHAPERLDSQVQWRVLSRSCV
jgi:hypothetical protein